MTRLLIIDNYDSFTYNLVHLIEKIFEGTIHTVRNDEVKIADVNRYHLVLFSPGPKLPKDAGKMMEIIDTYHTQKPIIGICLGMQGIVEYFGGVLEPLPVPKHGQSEKMIVLNKAEVFEHCPNEFMTGRYHSWGIQLKNIQPPLIPLSIDAHQWVMSIKHQSLKIYGLQYHPESILSEFGETVMNNIIKACLV